MAEKPVAVSARKIRDQIQKDLSLAMRALKKIRHAHILLKPGSIRPAFMNVQLVIHHMLSHVSFEQQSADLAVKGFYSPGEMLSKIRALLFKADMRKHMVNYKLHIHESRADAARLQQDMGMTNLFQCPHCKGEVLLDLIPDFSRTDGHWFFSHFVCATCNRSF